MAAPEPDLLIAIPMDDARRDRFKGRYTVHYAPDAQSRIDTIAATGDKIRALLTNGRFGMSGEHLRAMPNLEIACLIGAGYEALDVVVAREMGVVLASGAGTNADVVADHALALLFSLVRAIPQYDRMVRQGVWKDPGMMRPSLFGRRLGVLGLGHIGTHVTARASGFGMKVGYHTRTRRADAPYEYFGTLLEMAQWCDFLIVACPGGPGTYHMVDAAILQALGPAGFIVNIARGSVIDAAALIAALETDGIAGAGLDVIEGEPVIPPEILATKNMIITPHVAGGSPEAKRAGIDRVLESLDLHFAGKSPRVLL